ncbi:MAG: DUF6879 family protein [Egibacteraceae bacterium]
MSTLLKAFNLFAVEAFRLETLQAYRVEAEAEEFAAFLRGEPVPVSTPGNSPWLRRIAETTAQGKRWRRVHVIRLPLSDYLRYELSCQLRDNVPAGEDIRVIDAAWSVPAVLNRDFWAFDTHTAQPVVWLMNYDVDGRFLGSSPPSDPWPVDFIELQQVSWSWAMPLHRFMREHGDEVQAVS